LLGVIIAFGAAKMADVVIIGAGISGAATAYELATAGLDVVLLDRYAPAAMASGWTLAGVRQSGRDPSELPLARAAVEIWASLAERLDAPTHYRRGGNLRLALRDGEMATLKAMVRDQSAAGLPISLLHGAEAVREIAPAVSANVLGASFCPSDGHADPKATVQAFVDAAVRAGARTRFGERVVSIDRAGNAGGIRAGRRVIGVTTDKAHIPAGHVVLAAGIFGNELLRPLGLHVPLDVKLVTVLRSVPMSPVLEQVIGVVDGACAGRQEVTGRFRYTSGMQDWHGQIEDGVLPRVCPTARGIAHTIRHFGDTIPAIHDAPVDEVWAGLIDQTPDALPVLQAVEEPAGLVVAMGFSGHGFCLGPITGRIMAAFVQGDNIDLPLEPFRIERFDGWNGVAEPITLHG
jgi:sarcosine oxidase subunit beta